MDIIEGKFLTKKVWLPEAASVDLLIQQAGQGANVVGARPRLVEVYRSEEKGTDVNLATHLVHDAHLSRFDAALVVSNDSDLKEAVRIVKNEIGKVVVIYTPHRNAPSVQLKNAATLFREIKTAHLRDSQFPSSLTDSRNAFHKPASC